MLLLLFALFQQPEHVAWLGDLGEIDLGLDFRRALLFLRRRRVPGRKVFADFFSLVVFNRA
jgi:hypothetical protein